MVTQAKDASTATVFLIGVAALKVCSGGVLLSHEASLAVPSALAGLTSGFGMGPGVSLPLWPPQLCGGVWPVRAVSPELHSGRVACLVWWVVCAKPSAG